MTMDETYEHPLSKRYASKEMSKIWSANKKFTTWRKLWLTLAEVQRELGLEISQEQIKEMSDNIDNIDYKLTEDYEKKFRHDVMAHIHAFGAVCPLARPIIHFGATSCFVVDNTEAIQMQESMSLVKTNLLVLMDKLKQFCTKYQDLPTLGFTHYQPAQLVTVGKRSCLWLQDFMLDFHRLERELDIFPLRGVKGTTGTQASFLKLFEGDTEKVKLLNKLVSERLGFKKSIGVSAQTYTRKLDFFVLSVLSGIAQSAHKMATDIRLLANLKEIEEPFETDQIGSSAMAYKRNPMRCERVCSLARYAMNLLSNAAFTHSTQWLERTLDDSANRRLILPEAFLAVDSVIRVSINVISNLHVWPNVINQRIMLELPFMATENILMECVKKGGDRQTLHEAIRQHSMEAGYRIKNEGAQNDLLDRIRKDDSFKAIHDSLDDILDPKKYIGCSSEQVTEFIAEEIQPILDANEADLVRYIEEDLKV